MATLICIICASAGNNSYGENTQGCEVVSMEELSQWVVLFGDVYGIIDCSSVMVGGKVSHWVIYCKLLHKQCFCGVLHIFHAVFVSASRFMNY